MKLELKENQGVPSSLLWTLAIISGVTVANIYYNQPLLNRISRDLNISEFTANLIAMCSQIGICHRTIVHHSTGRFIPQKKYYPRKYFHSGSLTAHHCFSSQYPPDTVRFSADGCLFGYTPDIHAPCGTIFHSRNQRKECRYYPFGTTDGYSCFACSKRHCRRIHGLADLSTSLPRD